MKNFFAHIRLEYDDDTCILLKRYCRETKRLAKQTERLKYLLNCRSNGLTPTHLTNSTRNTRQLFTSNEISRELNKVEQKFHIKILNLEIKETNINIRNIKKERRSAELKIKSRINDNEYENFLERQKIRYNNIILADKMTHATKITNLKRKQLETFNLKFNSSWFVNKTNIEFSDENKWLLSLGSKFSLPVNNKNFSTVNLIADIEQWVQTLDDDREKEIIRSKITNRILTYKRATRNNLKEKFILRVYEDTKQLLRKYKDKIVVTKSDKGNKTVVIYKEDYRREMNKLLDDKTTYKTIRNDPTQKLQRMNNKLIMELYKEEYITKYEKIKLTSNAATAPRLYGLPKIHKPNVPLRPISSSIEVPCYNLSKYIGNILKNIILEKYNIKNSVELKKKLENVNLEDGEILISLDVVSLFTNIPIHLAIKNIMDQWNTLQKFTKIPRTQFLKILKFCLNDNNYFIYDETFYNQTYGMPMGNPLSPTIADIVLDALLEQTTNDLKKQGVNLKLLTKYVDDLFAIIKEEDEELILKTFNNYHNKIKFTIEKEENQSIPYLDMRLFRDNNMIITDWYTKSIASGRLINYHSTQPTQQKTNTAKNMIEKVLKISDDKFKDKNINKIREILLNNCYPIHIINNLIQKTILGKTTDKIDTSGNPKKFYCLSYIPKLTESKQIREIIHDKEVTLAYKANKTTQELFTKTKTKIEKEDLSSVVYQISCQGKTDEHCNKVYIGTTKRSLQTRIAEHETDIRKNKHTTALAQHCFEHGHNADLTNVKILDKERKENKRYILESLRIQQKMESAINIKDEYTNTSYILALV